MLRMLCILAVCAALACPGCGQQREPDRREAIQPEEEPREFPGLEVNPYDPYEPVESQEDQPGSETPYQS